MLLRCPSVYGIAKLGDICLRRTYHLGSYLPRQIDRRFGQDMYMPGEILSRFHMTGIFILDPVHADVPSRFYLETVYGWVGL